MSSRLDRIISLVLATVLPVNGLAAAVQPCCCIARQSDEQPSCCDAPESESKCPRCGSGALDGLRCKGPVGCCCHLRLSPPAASAAPVQLEGAHDELATADYANAVLPVRCHGNARLFALTPGTNWPARPSIMVIFCTWLK